MSIYHYSNDWPYGANQIPAAGKFEAFLTGTTVAGLFNIYAMFSGPAGSTASKGGKPFFVSETGATIFLVEKEGTATT